MQVPLTAQTTSYLLNLMVNQTYTIKMYASNSVGMGPAEIITWPMTGNATFAYMHAPLNNCTVKIKNGIIMRHVHFDLTTKFLTRIWDNCSNDKISTEMSTSTEESENKGIELKVIIGGTVGGIVLLVILIIIIIVCVRIR